VIYRGCTTISRATQCRCPSTSSSVPDRAVDLDTMIGWKKELLITFAVILITFTPQSGLSVRNQISAKSGNSTMKKHAVVFSTVAVLALAGCTSTNPFTGQSQVSNTAGGALIGAGGGALGGALIGG